VKKILIAVSAVTVLAACGSGEGQVGATTCVGLRALESTASAVIDDAASTIQVGDAKAALNTLEAAYDQFSADLRQAAPAVSKQFEAAEQRLQDALATVPDSKTLSQAGAEADQARKELRQTYKALVTAAGC